MDVIGHGIDLVEIARIEGMLAEHGARFRQRCFTDAEQAYAEAAGGRRAERYAARFAAKEAVLKALGTGWRDGIAWTDIEIVSEPSGRPGVTLGGRCAEIASELGIRRWRISLTHAGGFASASALACGGSGASGDG
ncbi:MAG: holo-ACP synthase [Planctomycetota bacterium]|nr:holo-ACP synthase [Planctomycetota bacterium]